MKEITKCVKADMSQFETSRLFIVEELKRLRVSKQLIKENELVFEELFLRIIEQYNDSNLDITISLVSSLGEVRIQIGFTGERFNIDFHSMEQYNPGAAILSKYEEKIGLTYRKRYNSIDIIAKRSYDRMGILCFIAILLAICTYAVADMALNHEALNDLYSRVIFPMEGMFGNAMMMIATPVTFFSLVTNITNCYIISDNRIELSRLGRNVIFSAAIAEILAIAYHWFLINIFGNSDIPAGEEYNQADDSFMNVFLNTVYDIVPKDIIHPFMDISPFPIIFLAIITAAALCTTNKHFDTIKGINDAINALLSRALSIIMLFIPVATFLAIMDVLVEFGYRGILLVGIVVLALFAGVLLMIMLAGAKVAVYGINPVSFLKKCIPAAMENFKINSSIDAVPYNIRFCNKSFGVSVSRLETEIPILAQVNQSGNSFILMLSSMFLMDYAGIDYNILSLVLLGILLIFISLGAPGQDGSLLVGLLFIHSFLGISFVLIAMFFYIEAIIGRSLPVLNTLFDITTVVTGDKKDKRREAKCRQ